MSSTFAWHDLFTKDRQSSMEFYSALFGYTFEEEENRAIFSMAKISSFILLLSRAAWDTELFL